jgi:lipopolysaccharide/colanic/teichoic acid biosynthesis glycosyltransferase
LLAILGGEMDFVGPRPLQPSTVAGFGKLGALRGQVRPGLTGWAQVNGNTRLSEREKLALDIWYIDHRSVALDVWIVFLTAATILRGESRSAKHIVSALSHLHGRAGDASTEVPLERSASS